MLIKRTLFALAVIAGLAVAFADPYVHDTGAWLTDPAEASAGGSVTLAVLSGSRTWNIVASREADDARDLTMGDFSVLLRRDPVTQVFEPWAAESYEVSDDGLVVTVKLRPELQWSDGEQITAADYMLFYTTTQDPEVESPNADLFTVGDQVVEVTSPDESTLIFRFPEPNRRALAIVTFVQPVPDHILGEVYREGGAEAFKSAWGTDTPVDELVFDGPFMIQSYSPDERYTLVRNPGWSNWNVDSDGNPLPYLDQVNVTIAEQEAQLNLFLAGELDIYAPANLDDVSVVAQANNAGEIDVMLRPNLYQTESRLFYTFNWNLASDPFKQEVFRSVAFRQAMSHLTPRESLVDLVYGGAAEPMYLPVNDAFKFWLPPEERQIQFPFDPERALELLAEVGFTESNSDGWLVDADGNELGFKLVTNSGNAVREQTIQIIADTMREYGVKVETEALDFSLLVDQLLSTGEDRPFDAILIGLTGGSLDWFFSDSVYSCKGSLHMWNTSGECLVPSETLISELALEGQRTLDDPQAQEYAYRLLDSFGRLQPMIQTVGQLNHAAWASDVGGEYDDSVLNSIIGTRSLMYTYRR